MRKDHTSTFVKIFLCLIVIRFMLLSLVLLLMVPKQESSNSETQKGNIIIEVFWENHKDIDIDVWVKSPNDEPVGWRRKNGRIFDLVRDDVGSLNNPSGIHYEILYGRNIIDGEYIVNVHWYANRENNMKEVEVRAVFKHNKDDSKNPPTIFADKKFIIKNVGDEITALRFNLKNKEIEKESINQRYYGIIYQ